MTTLITWFLIVFSIVVVLTLWIMWSDILGAGFEPTSRRLVRRMLELAEVKEGDLVYDLGSGDGRIVIEAARRYKARAVGIEADPLRFLYSRMMIVILGLNQQVKIEWGNFFNGDLSPATVITLFLSQKANQKLKRKLISELRPGTRIVSYYWRIHGWKPVKEDKISRIYVYVLDGTEYIS